MSADIENLLVALDFDNDGYGYYKELNPKSKDRFLHQVEVLKEGIKDGEIVLRIYRLQTSGWRITSEEDLIGNHNNLHQVAKCKWMIIRKALKDAGVKVKVITNLL